MTDPTDPRTHGERPQPAPHVGAAPVAGQPVAGTPAPTVPEAALVAQGIAPEAAGRAVEMVDGDWHRLHPATPLLRGGLALIVIGAIAFNSFRDVLVNLFIPDEFEYDQGPDQIVERLIDGTLVWVLLAVLGVIVLCVVGFWFSWRVHRFRITGDLVEVQQGILFRRHRRAPIARIQGVNIEKPWYARIFGACKLEVQSAGADANVDLAYLSNAVADALRFEILARAAGRSTTRQEPGGPQQGSHAQRVVGDILRPDAEVAHLEPTSLVRIRPGTVLASSVLDLGLVISVVVGIGAVIAMIVLDIPWLLFTLIPTAFALVSVTTRTLAQKLRYSIAQTPDGIRLAYGLISTTTEILPAGRIFSISVSQPLLWRPFGWWKVAFTRAAKADPSSGQQKQYVNMLLPVGDIADVETVLGLVIPELRGSAALRDGLVGTGDDGYVTSSRRARPVRWFSWRRNGIVLADGAVLLRTGRIWRGLGIVPLARTQSLAMHQGPIGGALGVARVVVHVVGSVLSPSVGALDVRDVERVFEQARVAVPAAIGADITETWRVRSDGEAPPQRTPQSTPPQSPPISQPPAARPQPPAPRPEDRLASRPEDRIAPQPGPES